MSATHTPNLNLAKPDREDYVSVVADLNDNMDIIDAAFASIQNTLRKVPISIAVGDWTLDDGVYYAEFSTAYITDASFEFVFFDRSYKQYAVSDINANKHTGGGGLDFETTAIPTGTITGTAYVFATNDGKLPVIIENTVIDIANGGTGQSSVSGVQSAFGIGDPTQLHTVDKTNLVSAVNENADNIVTLNSKLLNENIGTFSTKAALESALDTLLASIEEDGTQSFKFVVSTAFDIFSASSVYVGMIHKSGSGTTYAHVNFGKLGAFDEIVGYKSGSSGWSFVNMYGWTKLNVTENTTFALPTIYKEIWIEGTLSAGYRLGTTMAFIPNRTSRIDFGFYYNSSTYGSGSAIISNTNNLNVAHPFYNGSQTTYSNLEVYAR